MVLNKLLEKVASLLLLVMITMMTSRCYLLATFDDDRNVEVVRYSDNHGPKCELSEANTLARRYEGGCWAVCMTEQQLRVNETLRFNITERETGWLSNMNVGVIYKDPDDIMPGDLVICEENVTDALPDTEVFIFKRFYSVDNVYNFRIDDKGRAYLAPNVTYNDVVFTGVNVTRKFWVIFNIYGDTKAIKLLGKTKADSFGQDL